MGNLEDLVQHRPMLLLAEAVAWLHDMGKCDERHLKKSASDYEESKPIEYDYKTTHSHRVGMQELKLLKESVPLKDLIEQSVPSVAQDVNQSWLIRTLGYCHGIAHTEKEDQVYYVQKQTIDDTRYSSPFGYESEHLTGLEVKLKELPFSQISDPSKFKQPVKEAFDHTCADSRRPVNEVTLWDWSMMVAAFYKAALAASILLDEKIDPLTLHWRLLSIRFDGISFLTRVARLPDLLARRKLIEDGLSRVRRLLEERYPLGTEIYNDENGSVFLVPDLSNLLDLQDRQGNTLQALITRKFYAGTVKEDDTLRLEGEVVPALQVDMETKRWPPKDQQQPYPSLPISDHIRQTPSLHADPQLVSSWWNTTKEEVCTVCCLRPQGWRAPDSHEHTAHRAKGEQFRAGCLICKALERRVCAICEQRREDQSKEWASKLNTTIWLDEIADVHGRLALIVGTFGLEPWLSGDMLFYPKYRKTTLSVLKTKTVGPRPPEGKEIIIKNYKYIWDDSQGVLRSTQKVPSKQLPSPFRDQDIYVLSLEREKVEQANVVDIERLSDGNYMLQLNRVLRKFSPGESCHIRGTLFRVTGNGSQVETASTEAAKVVEDRVLHEGLLIIELPAGEEEVLVAERMIPAHTPARLHRVWETTQTFWKDSISNFKNTVGETKSRICVRGTLEDGAQPLVLFHTYDLKLFGVNLSVTKTDEEEFVIVDNLQRVAFLLNPIEEHRENKEIARAYVEGQLQKLLKEGKVLDIEEPTGYGSPNKRLGKLILKNVSQKNIPYIPAMSMLTEPRTFMALVPAQRALEVVKDMKQQYKQQLNKICARLPLALGIVFAGSRTPLPAILDAGHRMLKQPIKNEQWIVKKPRHPIPPHRWPSKVEVTLERGDQSLSLEIDTLMRDGKTKDVWYPFWHVLQERNHTQPKGRIWQLVGPQNRIWIHTHDLLEEDVVSFMPSRFDFEFLDTAARRFEVSYEDDRRRTTSSSTRPYYLEQLNELEELWTIISQSLTTTQIHNLLGIIETKRAAWQVGWEDSLSQQAFETVVHDALGNVEWRPNARPSESQLRRLCQAAVSGQLADVVELYIRILKCPTQLDKQEGNS